MNEKETKLVAACGLVGMTLLARSLYVNDELMYFTGILIVILMMIVRLLK
jgi:hypothetical protein